ncbi:MAG: ABC transporter ATP-binding protein [Candidatus Planktophila sp.]|nr:ABC transporter ATP-binding protein [Candidatus Planktophila sp.]
MTKPVIVSIRGLTRSFGDIRAVAGVDLDIFEGEFITLLGPSGSGKTTVLRMIAGFEKPDSGSIVLGGKDVSQLPPYDRDVNTVFQDYALFPHMDVISNIEYGLRVKGVDKSSRRERAIQALKQVRLEGYENRKPAQLSGGQRQRVALARALVNRPSVLLLDEPLGALDLKLREQMQIELKELQREVGITFIFVTHDQEEALTMSDRIAVFNHGRIEQLGSPREIYENPQSLFVSEFVGQTNKIEIEGRKVNIRPEFISVSKTTRFGDCSIQGTLRDAIFVGAVTRYLIDTTLGSTMISTNPTEDISIGESVTLSWDKEKEFLVQ